jgi:hypothetical protein
MRPFRLRLASLGLLLSSHGIAVQAQNAPPIKPGLWEVHSERLVNGQPMPDMAQRMKDMPPEARARMEAAMKARGGPNGGMKICHTKESLDQGRWQEAQTRCKTDVGSRSGSVWKWHSSCAEPMASETDGEVTFTSPESYAVKTSTTMTMKGQARSSQMTMTAKWLGSDCGTVKPVTAPAGSGKP